MNTDTALQAFTAKGLTLPDDLNSTQWVEIGKHIRLSRKAAATWWRQWRDFGSQKYGEEFVQTTEEQLELEMGLPPGTNQPRLNASDKSTAIVTIEGIRQRFDLWDRKMKDEIKTWDAHRLSRALELLEPMEQKAKEIRDLINAGGA